MKAPVQTIATVSMAVAIFLWSDATEFLTFHRGSSPALQCLTALSAQFTHWNSSHLICDAAAFLVLGSLVETRSSAIWRRLLFLSLLFVSVAVWLSPASITAYRGLSGIDAALFSAAAILIGNESAHQKNRPMFALAISCGLALAAKIGWEWATGVSLFARSGETSFVIAPLTHLAGAIAGGITTWMALHQGIRPSRPGVNSKEESARF